MSFRGEGSSLNLPCGSISKCEYSRESCQGLWKVMEPDGGQTEVRDRACPDWMFLVVLQLRQASGKVEPRGIPGGLCIYLMIRQWAPRARVFSGPKVASASLRLTVLPSCFRLDSAFFTALAQRSPSEELRREVSLGCPWAPFPLSS